MNDLRYIASALDARLIKSLTFVERCLSFNYARSFEVADCLPELFTSSLMSCSPSAVIYKFSSNIDERTIVAFSDSTLSFSSSRQASLSISTEWNDKRTVSRFLKSGC
jgi:hypothetical protein